MCGLSGRVPVVHGVHGVDVGADSFTNRWPAPLTRMQPGRLRSARQKYGPAGQRDRRAPPGVVHQAGRGASGLAGGDPVAGVPGRAGRPVGADRRALVPAAHLRVALEPAGGDQHAAAGPDQRRLAVAGHADPGDPAVGHVPGRSAGYPARPARRWPAARPAARRQRLAQAEHPLPEQPGARQSGPRPWRRPGSARGCRGPRLSQR